jgi:hypothetical protein
LKPIEGPRAGQRSLTDPIFINKVVYIVDSLHVNNVVVPITFKVTLAVTKRATITISTTIMVTISNTIMLTTSTAIMGTISTVIIVPITMTVMVTRMIQRKRQLQR